MDEQQVAEAAQSLSRTVTPGDLDRTLGNITAAAVAVLPDVDYASITIHHRDGRLETVAPTDPLLCEIDAAQYEHQEGPCYEAAVESVHVTASDLATDERFPTYSGYALAKGIQAQVGVRLFDGPHFHGALNLYSRTRGAFSDLGSLAALFAHQSATAIDYAHQIRTLEEALTVRRTVGQAVGIAMERYEFSEQQAFAFLTRLAQAHDAGLPRVSTAIIAASEERGS